MAKIKLASPKEIFAALQQFGPPDATTPLYPIPASHKANWDDADFACQHIALKGSEAGGDGYYERMIEGVGRVLFCEACNKHFNHKAAAAGGK
jgi:hypothetical protein